MGEASRNRGRTTPKGSLSAVPPQSAEAVPRGTDGQPLDAKDFRIMTLMQMLSERDSQLADVRQQITEFNLRQQAQMQAQQASSQPVVHHQSAEEDVAAP